MPVIRGAAAIGPGRFAKWTPPNNASVRRGPPRRNNAGRERPGRYKMYSLYRARVLGTFGVATAVAVGLIVAAGASHVPVWFCAVWAAAVAWNGYWFLFRVAYDLSFDGTTVLWRAPLRSGALSLQEVTGLRPSRFGPNVELLASREGRPVVVLARPGFRPFAEALAAARPDLGAKRGGPAPTAGTGQPGSPRRRPGRRVFWFAAGAWLVAFMFFAVPGIVLGGWADDYGLQTSGAQATATVTGLQPDNHGGCSYTYRVGRRLFSGSQEACPAVGIGSHVEVTYLPSKPSVSVVGNGSGLLTSHVALSLVVPTVLALGVGATLSRRRLRREQDFGGHAGQPEL